MPTWLNLALIEFSRSVFRPRWPSPPGGRDHFWLTGLLALLFATGLIFSGATDGLLRRTTDSMLGSLGTHGIAVRLASSVDRAIGFDQQAIQAIKEQLGVFHPFRKIEANDPYVRLAGNDSWRGEEEFGTGFTGWAVSADDPIWRWARDQAVTPGGGIPDPAGERPAPLVLIVSESQFGRYFDTEAYAEEVKSRVSPGLLTGLPDDGQAFERGGGEVSDALPDHLWLEVTVDRKRELHRFRVTWVPGIPTPESVVFLLPASVYHLLSVSNRLVEADRQKGIAYFPESEGEAGRRVTGLSLYDIDIAGPVVTPGALAAMVECLGPGAEGTAAGPDYRVELDPPLPPDPVRQCIAQTVGPEWVDGCCSYQTAPAWPRPAISFAESQSCPPDDVSGCDTVKDWLQRYEAPGFGRGNAYVGGLAELTGFVDQVRQLTDGDDGDLRRRYFMIDPAYERSLEKFSFLRQVFDWIGWPLVLLGLLVAGAMVFMILSWLVGHRKQVYGLLLARGVTAASIRAMLVVQIVCSVGVAALVGAVVAALVRMAVNHLFVGSSAAAFARERLGVVQSGVIEPFHLVDLALLFLVLLALCLGSGLILLYRSSVSPRHWPSDLLR